MESSARKLEPFNEIIDPHLPLFADSPARKPEALFQFHLHQRSRTQLLCTFWFLGHNRAHIVNANESILHDINIRLWMHDTQ